MLIRMQERGSRFPGRLVRTWCERGIGCCDDPISICETFEAPPLLHASMSSFADPYVGAPGILTSDNGFSGIDLDFYSQFQNQTYELRLIGPTDNGAGATGVVYGLANAGPIAPGRGYRFDGFTTSKFGPMIRRAPPLGSDLSNWPVLINIDGIGNGYPFNPLGITSAVYPAGQMWDVFAAPAPLPFTLPCDLCCLTDPDGIDLWGAGATGDCIWSPKGRDCPGPLLFGTTPRSCTWFMPPDPYSSLLEHPRFGIWWTDTLPDVREYSGKVSTQVYLQMFLFVWCAEGALSIYWQCVTYIAVTFSYRLDTDGTLTYLGSPIMGQSASSTYLYGYPGPDLSLLSVPDWPIIDASGVVGSGRLEITP